MFASLAYVLLGVSLALQLSPCIAAPTPVKPTVDLDAPAQNSDSKISLFKNALLDDGSIGSPFIILERPMAADSVEDTRRSLSPEDIGPMLSFGESVSNLDYQETPGSIVDILSPTDRVGETRSLPIGTDIPLSFAMNPLENNPLGMIGADIEPLEGDAGSDFKRGLPGNKPGSSHGSQSDSAHNMPNNAANKGRIGGVVGGGFSAGPKVLR